MNIIWSKIVLVYKYTKEYTLKAEELNIDKNAFLPSFSELRSAFDHVARTKNRELECKTLSEEDEKYINDNLEKALGHVYRAFFDTADWLATVLKSKTTEIINRYSSNTVRKVIPGYYSETEPKFEEWSLKIAGYRNNKDISSIVIGEIEQYSSIVEQLLEFYIGLQKCIPSLEKIHIEERKKEKRKIALNIASIIFGIVGVVGVIYTIIKGCI